MGKNKILLVSFLLIFSLGLLFLNSDGVFGASEVHITSPSNDTTQDGSGALDVIFRANSSSGDDDILNCSLWYMNMAGTKLNILAENYTVKNYTLTTLSTGVLTSYLGNSTNFFIACNTSADGTATTATDVNSTIIFYNVNKQPVVSAITDDDKGMVIHRIGGDINWTAVITDTQWNLSHDPFTIYICRSESFSIADGCGGKGEFCSSPTNTSYTNGVTTHTCKFTSSSSYLGGTKGVYVYAVDSNNYVSEPYYTTFKISGVTPALEDLITDYCAMYGYPLPKYNLGQLKKELMMFGYIKTTAPDSEIKTMTEQICAKMAPGAVAKRRIWLYVIIGIVAIGVLYFIFKKKKKRS